MGVLVVIHFLGHVFFYHKYFEGNTVLFNPNLGILAQLITIFEIQVYGIGMPSLRPLTQLLKILEF